MERPSPSSRRSLLRAVGLAVTTGIAGCGGRTGPRTYGLLVVNYRDSAAEIGVTVTRTDASETLLDETYALRSDGRASEASVFEDPTTYAITAKTAEASARTDFTVREDGQPPVDSFHVHLTTDGELNLFLPAP